MIKKDVLFADASRVHRAKSNALCPFQNNGSGRFDHVLVSPWKKENSLSSSPLSTCPSLAVASLPRRSFRDNAVPLARQHRGSFERCVRGDDDCEQRTPCELVQGGRDSTSFDADARQHVRDSRFSR